LSASDSGILTPRDFDSPVLALAEILYKNLSAATLDVTSSRHQLSNPKEASSNFRHFKSYISTVPVVAMYIYKKAKMIWLLWVPVTSEYAHLSSSFKFVVDIIIKYKAYTSHPKSTGSLRVISLILLAISLLILFLSS